MMDSGLFQISGSHQGDFVVCALRQGQMQYLGTVLAATMREEMVLLSPLM